MEGAIRRVELGGVHEYASDPFLKLARPSSSPVAQILFVRSSLKFAALKNPSTQHVEHMLDNLKHWFGVADLVAETTAELAQHIKQQLVDWLDSEERPQQAPVQVKHPCSSCGKSNANQICDRCRGPRYCDRNWCQVM